MSCAVTPDLEFLSGRHLDVSAVSSIDWSLHDLGSPAGWPSVLKDALSNLARTPIPTCVSWGDNSYFFSNTPFEDLYSSISHPRIGQDAALFFNRTIDVLLTEAPDSILPFCSTHRNSPADRFKKSALVDGRYTISRLGRDPSEGVGLIMSCEKLDLPEAEANARLETNLSCASFHTGMGMTLLALNGKCLDANPAFSRLLGYTKDELLQASCHEITHPDDLDATIEMYDKIQKLHVSSLKIEKRFRKKDGNYLWAQTTVSCVRDLEDRPIAMVVMTEDIEERCRNRDRLIQEKEAAESANRLKSAFLANMSHEIRTPLGIMMGFSDLLTQTLSAEERISYARTLKRNGEQLSVIVNDILDLSKVESGFLKIEVVDFSLRRLLEDVWSSLKPKAAEKNLEFAVRMLEPISDHMTSDPMRLKQILLNVLGNAIKFTDRGWVKATVLHNNGQLVVEIADSGIGMSHSSQALLFSPFQQADASITRQYGGTGLGLALSKKLAQLMSGDLVLKESTEDRGSVFELRISNSRAEESEPPVRTPIARFAGEGDFGFRDLSVLLIDDSEDNQLLISTILNRAGANVEFAKDGAEGFRKALAGDYDVVLMDIQMPVMDGYTATHRLRCAGFDRPIIALTAHAMSGVARRCLDAGCDDYVPKPINAKKFLRSVGRIAGHRHPGGARPAELWTEH